MQNVLPGKKARNKRDIKKGNKKRKLKGDQSFRNCLKEEDGEKGRQGVEYSSGQARPLWPPISESHHEAHPTEMSAPLLRPEVIGEDHTGQWCVVIYNPDLYPGIIVKVEEHDIKVKCMHMNGINKFFWPSPREDISWYGDEQIVCFIPEPTTVNKRYIQIDKKKKSGTI